jgi:hypothetical protein
LWSMHPLETPVAFFESSLATVPKFRDPSEKLSKRSHPSDLPGTDSTHRKVESRTVQITHLILLQCVFLCMGLRLTESDYLMKMRALKTSHMTPSREIPGCRISSK